MPATFGIATQVATTSMVAIAATAVTGSKVRRLDIRAANVHGSADANISWELYNGSTSITRGKNFPVPFNTAGSAPDLETGLVVPTGWSVRIQASAASAVEVSVAWVEDDA